jgi:hypothetical protein
VSGAFRASANGFKLKPIIIIPSKTELPSYEPPEDVSLAYNAGGTFNEQLIVNYFIRRSLWTDILSNGLRNPLLVMDQALCHSIAQLASKLQVQIKIFFI